jgi:hypothetical protein
VPPANKPQKIIVQEHITGAIRPNPNKGCIMKVAVVDTNGKTLAPTTPRMAKILLRRRKAAVLRRFPFTLILKKEVENPLLPDLRLKIDPGSKTTGLAIVNQESGEIVFADSGPQATPTEIGSAAIFFGRVIIR